MHLGRYAVVLAANLTFGSALAQQSVVLLTANEKRIEYQGYVAEKVYDQVLQSWTVRLSRGDQQLGIFAAKDRIFESQHISMALHPVLGGANQQLIVGMWTGGTKCCNIYWVAELVPEFHLVFDGREYDSLRDSDGAHFGAGDLDGDGQLEFWQDITTFDYFRGSFADSPSVTIYFKYDPSEKVVPDRKRSILADY